MNKNNALFLGEYKKLDDICKASLDMEEGIADYVKEMELSAGPKKNVDAWVDDYHTLNKCLHIVKLLDGEGDAANRAQCTKQDIAWIKQFRQKIANGEDPMKELEKYHDKLRLIEEKKKLVEPYVEKALSVLVIGVILLLAVADSKNKKKIEEQMKLKKQKKKKEKKKKQDTTEIVE